jgi:alginate O-acetyltransferase complex protein AlgI
MFRAGSVHDALAVYSGMLGLNGIALRPEVSLDFSREALLTLAAACFVVAVEPWLRPSNEASAIRIASSDGAAVVRGSLAAPLLLCLLATVTVLKLAEASYSPFLYFQF